jgi:serine/threonine protein kinase
VINFSSDEHKRTEFMSTYLAHGTYGCVVTPGMSRSKPFNGKTVSKLFRESSAASEELKTDRLVRSVDPSHKFAVASLDSNRVNFGEVNETELKKCEWKLCDIRRSDYPNIVYPNAGESLHKAATSKYHFRRLFRSFEPVLEGLIRLEKKKMCHRDIKPDNMVYNSDTNETKLIDFGLATSFDHVFRARDYEILMHPYPYYPPEFRAIGGYHSASISKSDAQSNLVRLMGRTFGNMSVDRWKSQCPTLFAQIDHLRTLEFAQKDLAQLIDDLTHRPATFLKSCVKKAACVDVYAVGASLLELLYECHHYSRGLPEDEQRVHFERYETFYVDVLKLIQGMIAAHPLRRLSPQQALQKYRRIVRTYQNCPHDLDNRSPVKDLKPPAPRQARSPVKKKDKKTKSIKAELKACPTGKVRDSKTNRCRMAYAKTDGKTEESTKSPMTRFREFFGNKLKLS